MKIQFSNLYKSTSYFILKLNAIYEWKKKKNVKFN